MRFALLFLSLLHLSIQRSTPGDDSYVAAVVEYEVLGDTDTNILNYMRLIGEAAQQNADLIVFPEMTLNRGDRSAEVPIHGILREYPVPADHPELYNELLVNISSAAKENAIYVVINIQEIMNCEDAPNEVCPERRTYFFNTNVVFDRNGAVIDRYRKINLFGEFTRTPALQPDLGIFSTDFGVTFGHFICFDLLFQVPAVQTPQKHNLTDIIFTTMWFSELPYLTAVQIQESYAYTFDVNFLASGANNVRIGSAGSGIYSGKAGALISIMPGVPTTRLLVTRVPKVPGQVTEPYPGPIYDDPSDHDNLRLKTDPSLLAHQSQLIEPGSQDFILTYGTTICRFRVTLNEAATSGVRYRAFVHDGLNTWSFRRVGAAGCVVTACQNEDPATCPYKFKNEDSRPDIEKLDIKMSSHPVVYNTTLQCNDVQYFGLSFRNNKFPLSPVNYTFIEKQDGDNQRQNGGQATRILKLKTAQSDLVAFGIWSRIYNEDNSPLHLNKTDKDVETYNEIEQHIYGNKQSKNEL